MRVIFFHHFLRSHVCLIEKRVYTLRSDARTDKCLFDMTSADNRFDSIELSDLEIRTASAV